MTWDETVAQYEDLLPDARAEVEALRKTDVDALDTQKAYQAGLLQKQMETAKQQAYITREMNKRDMPQYLAQQGLSGGITETAANELLRSYRNAVNSADESYTTNLNDLENTYATNLASTNSTYGQMLMQALADQRAEALQRALYAAQMAAYNSGGSSGSSSGGGSGGTETSATPSTPQAQQTFGYLGSTYNPKTNYVYSNTGTKGVTVKKPKTTTTSGSGFVTGYGIGGKNYKFYK